jgi:hypothetical protein
MANSKPSNREQLLAAGRERWRTALHEALGDTPATRSEWTDLNEMPNVLAPFMGKGVGHTYLPTGGGMDMVAASVGRERGTLELRPGRRAAYIFKPTRLMIHYFAQAPAQSFVYITTAPLKASGVYDYNIDDMEELVEIAPRDYRERVVWDQGYIGHDECGDEIPIPEDARLALRFLRGHFMIVGHGSVWNGTPHTYDGEHNQLGEQGVRDLIQSVITAQGL